MDDRKKDDQLQGASEVPQPIYETVPVGGGQQVQEQPTMQPEEISSNVQATDQEDFTQIQPEIAPIDVEPPRPSSSGQNNKLSQLSIVIGGGAIFILVFIMIFALLAGQGKKKPPVEKQIVLNYWGLWEEKEVLDPLIKEYQKAHPNITVTYEKKTEQDYRQKLITWIKKGQGPDIYRFHNTWIPEIQEIVSPLPESVMSVADFEKTFYPIFTKDLKFGSKVYGMPLMIDGLVMIVNEDLLKKAGISSIPSNWDDMIAAANQMTVKEKNNRIITAGFAAGTASNVAHFSNIFGLMLLLNGGDLTKLDKPEAIGTLQAYRAFAEEPNNVWSEEMPNSIAAFTEGKVAIIFAPSWEIHTIRTNAPDLKIAVAPIPSPPGGKQFSLATYWVEGVSNKSHNQLEAWKFLAFLASKESETKLYEIQSSVRTFGAAYSRIDLSELLIQDQYLGPVIKQAAEDRYVSLPLMVNTFDGGLNDEIVRYLENAINGASQGVSYDEAMKTAKSGIDQVLLRYKIQ